MRKFTIKYTDPDHGIRKTIKQMTDIIDKFCTEEGFDEITTSDRIELCIGKDDPIRVYVCPATWEITELWLKFNICYFINEYGLDKYPYYDALYHRFSDNLDCPEPTEF